MIMVGAITPAIMVPAVIPPRPATARPVAIAPIVAVIIPRIGFIVAATLTTRAAIVIIAALALAIIRAIALVIASALIGALGASLVLAQLVIVDNAEVMVGELQEIFCLHTVPIMLRVLSQLLVFVEQLRRVTAGPAVDSVKLVSTTATTATSALGAIGITTAAAVTVTISIAVQGSVFPHSSQSAAKNRCCLQNCSRTHLNAGRGAPSAFTSSDCARAA